VSDIPLFFEEWNIFCEKQTIVSATGFYKSEYEYVYFVCILLICETLAT